MLWHWINQGGITMYVLLVLSVVSLGIIMERVIYFKRCARLKRLSFMMNVTEEFKNGNFDNAVALCVKVQAPISKVVHAGLRLFGYDEKAVNNAMEREIAVQTSQLEQFTSIVGTIGSTAVYIGLFGTVLGVIHAFRSISESGTGGMSVVIGGISEALVCTAAGLLVAVPAVIAYNYFVKKIDHFVTDMELCASETIDLMAGRHK